MKSFSKLGLAVATAALLVPGVARADDAGTRAGWYAGVGAMASFQLDADSDVGNVTNKLGYDAGWGLNGDVGYAWGNGFRAEGEVAYRRTGDVNSITGTGARTDGGHIRNISLMANGYYDFATGTRFTPYVGAGFGTSVVDAFNVRRVDGYTLDSERAEFAYQGMAGLAYSLDSHWVVTGEYRYFSTLSPKFKATDGVTRADTDNASHNFLVGIRYAFGQPETPAHAAPAPAPVAAPAVAPVAAPVVPAVPQSYMVFFDFDRASLTPEAKRIIAFGCSGIQEGQVRSSRRDG